MIIDGEEYVAIKEFPTIVGGPESLMKLIEAPQKGVIGTSTIAVIIDELGNPLQFSIADTLGSGYDEAVIEALKKSEFKPAIKKDGTPVKFKFSISVDFK